MTERKYPIAEMFDSVQGEGFYAGTAMTFVRFAGCSVGKPYTKDTRPAGLPIYVEKCTTWDGRSFDCDTNFQTKEILTVSKIAERIPSNIGHVCLTGGEPLIHDLSPLIDYLFYRLSIPMIHVETSGTIYESAVFGNTDIWVAVSPKHDCLDRCIKACDEIKLLVDENFDLNKAKELVKRHQLIYIQPISGEHELNFENVNHCLEIQKQMPDWRLSMQLHKILKVR